jgi:hypothetical protein
VGELRYVFAYRMPEGGYDVYVRNGQLATVKRREFKRWINVREYFATKPACVRVGSA